MGSRGRSQATAEGFDSGIWPERIKSVDATFSLGCQQGARIQAPPSQCLFPKWQFDNIQSPDFISHTVGGQVEGRGREGSFWRFIHFGHAHVDGQSDVGRVRAFPQPPAYVRAVLTSDPSSRLSISGLGWVSFLGIHFSEIVDHELHRPTFTFHQVHSTTSLPLWITSITL